MATVTIVPPVFTRPKMNGWEADYAGILAAQLHAGEIADYEFEAVKFRLAKATWYTPDFMVVYVDRIEFHEIKGGHYHDDARVKWKAAADLFPWFVWRWISKKRKRDAWRYEHYVA